MNPTGTPEPLSPLPPMGSTPMGPKEALNLPSLFIVIVAGLSALYALYSLASNPLANIPPDVLNNPDLAPIVKASASFGKVFSVIAIGIYGFTVFGALKMRNLQSYGMAMASAITVMLPCTCCCVLGLPAGIWALVMLNKPEVKAAFTA